MNLKSWVLLLKQNKIAVLTAVWLTVLGDISFSQIRSDVFIFGILGLYILVIRVFKLKSKATFSLCFFVLGLLLIEFVSTGVSEHTEKAAVWLFLFMTIGIVQEVPKR